MTHTEFNRYLKFYKRIMLTNNSVLTMKIMFIYYIRVTEMVRTTSHYIYST